MVMFCLYIASVPDYDTISIGALAEIVNGCSDKETSISSYLVDEENRLRGLRGKVIPIIFLLVCIVIKILAPFCHLYATRAILTEIQEA